MKSLFLLLFLVPITSCEYTYPTNGQQVDHLNKKLRTIQNDYGYRDLYIDIKVSNEAHTNPEGVWGDTHFDEHGAHIEILSAQGYPENYPRPEIENHQEIVLLHEFLHILFTAHSIPDENQDFLIKLIQPHLKEVK